MELPSDSELFEILEKRFIASPVAGVFLVGSRSRFHNLPNSDCEFMIFYDSDIIVKETSIFEIGGIPASISHYDKKTYYEATRSHVVNAGALRSLHKLRDGRCLYQTDAILPLLKLAGNAHLDPRFVLNYLSGMVVSWPCLRTANPIGQANQLLTWVEMATILEILSTPGQVAYSKPKWLYYFLRQAKRNNVIDALNVLYGYGDNERFDKAKKAVEVVFTKLQKECSSGAAPLVDLGVAQDAWQMVTESPTDSLPAVRYLAHHLYRRTTMEHLGETLKTKEIIPYPFFDMIGDLDWAMMVISHQYRAYIVIRTIAERLLNSFKSGSLPQLHADVFETFDSNSVLSITSRTQFQRDIENVRRFICSAPY